MSSIKKNLGYQTIYQLLATAMPLLTSPYLSRVLGAEQVGIFSYTHSIVTYFSLFAMLGTVNYGTRSIADVRDDADLCGKTFWSIFSLQVIASLISTLSYGIYLFCFCKKNQFIAWIQGIVLLSCLLDISWLYFGLEQFKTTVVRNTAIKLSSVALIFLLVRKKEHLWIYTLLMTGSSLIGQLILWNKLPVCCRRVLIQPKEIIRHIRPNLVLFIPLASSSVYHVMDKTMLGFLSTEAECGYYYFADKLINIPISLINGVGAVLLPRISHLLQQGNRKKADEFIKLSLEGILLSGAALSLGIFAVSDEFVPFFFGSEFRSSIIIAKILAPVLIIKGLSNTIRTEYLVPYRLEFKYITSVISGAITNIAANCILIPRFAGAGAAWGTLIAEAVSCGFQIVVISKQLDLRRTCLNGLVYIVIGVCMVFSVRMIVSCFQNTVISILVGILCGTIIFIALCLVFWKISRHSLLQKYLNIDKN